MPSLSGFAMNPSRKGDTTGTKKSYAVFVPELTTAAKFTALQDGQVNLGPVFLQINSGIFSCFLRPRSKREMCQRAEELMVRRRGCGC